MTLIGRKNELDPAFALHQQEMRVEDEIAGHVEVGGADVEDIPTILVGMESELMDGSKTISQYDLAVKLRYLENLDSELGYTGSFGSQIAKLKAKIFILQRQH